jgi:hypothetical protein
MKTMFWHSEEFKSWAMFFFNVQQMVSQLVVYLGLSLLLYHSSQTFQYINNSPFKKHVLC